MSDEVFSFDVGFQKKILNLVCKDVNFLIKASKYIKKEFFETEILRWVYKVIVDYYEKYQKMTTFEVFQQEIMDLPDDKNKLEYLSVYKDVISADMKEREYIIDKVQEWIRRNALKPRLETAVILYNKGKIDDCVQETLKAADDYKKISFTVPHRSYFFEDVEKRMIKREAKKSEIDNYRFTTGVIELDNIIGGGLTRGEFGVVVGDAKAGKSIFLMNVGAVNIRSFPSANVLHINLEGKNDQIDDRYEARLLQMNYREVTRNNLPDNIRSRYKNFNGKLVISNLNTSWNYTSEDIENEIIDMRADGFTPDIVIVDYGDLLTPRNTSADDKYKGQEECFRDLKTLAIKYNVAMWSASQVHRIDSKIAKPETDNTFYYTRRNLADSYAKVRIADLLITLNVTDEERRNNRLRVYVDAYRDSECGQRLSINTNYSNMQFYVPNNNALTKAGQFYSGQS